MEHKADRKKLKAQYIRGGVSYADLARAYKISESTVKRWAKADGWAEAKAEADRKADLKMVEDAARDKTKVEAGVLAMSDVLLEKLAMALDNERGDMEPGRVREYTAALRDLQQIRGDKPKLDMKEQKARISRLQQETKRIKQDTLDKQLEAEANKPENKTVTLEMVGVEEDYAG